MSDTKTITHVNNDGSITFQRHQDVEGILESNKQAVSEDQDNSAFGRRVANIPNIVIEQWLKEGINLYNIGTDPEVKRKVFQKLNSPDWRYLRTHNSRL